MFFSEILKHRTFFLMSKVQFIIGKHGVFSKNSKGLTHWALGVCYFDSPDITWYEIQGNLRDKKAAESQTPNENHEVIEPGQVGDNRIHIHHDSSRYLTRVYEFTDNNSEPVNILHERIVDWSKCWLNKHPNYNYLEGNCQYYCKDFFMEFHKHKVLTESDNPIGVIAKGIILVFGMMGLKLDFGRSGVSSSTCLPEGSSHS